MCIRQSKLCQLGYHVFKFASQAVCDAVYVGWVVIEVRLYFADWVIEVVIVLAA